MADDSLPRAYPGWRTDPEDRAEDAAHTFGFHLIEHCRDAATAAIPKHLSAADQAAVEASIDTALHNAMDLLEGFWRLPSGPSHTIEYSLQVRVLSAAKEVVETQEISPCRLDLPIGYWKWARDREFR